jgi:Family of unknown function (DUF6058)
MKVQEYLDRYYWTAQQLAESSGLAIGDLNMMVESGLVPKPSYVVVGSILESAAFGRLSAHDAREASYFNPATVSWIERVQNLSVKPSIEALRELFADNMATVLAQMNQSVWRLSDAFDDQGLPIPAGLNVRIDSYWHSLNDGIFGLCVVDPVSEFEIASKEILQEKLTAITNNGTQLEGSGICKEDLIDLIDAYARASMPFSPVEYPISSRKRLVDDLLAQFSTMP